LHGSLTSRVIALVGLRYGHPSMNDHADRNDQWLGLETLQDAIQTWQDRNFPDCKDWELALGVCEEAGELAQCVLKLHRRMRAGEFDEARLADAIGDVVVYLIGLCGSKGWRLSSVLRSTAERVLRRNWETANH
jgi:NTP pyrophosphatase (non-canonical NTP hydrolase)